MPAARSTTFCGGNPNPWLLTLVLNAMIGPRSTRTALLTSWVLACLVLACGLICPEPSQARPKADLVTMVDGDRLTIRAEAGIDTRAD